jgi:uncharacterized protein
MRIRVWVFLLPLILSGVINTGRTEERFPDPTQGLSITWELIAAAHEKACAWSDGGSCFRLGLWHGQGELIEHDIDKALQYFQTGCQLNHALGCEGAGVIYWELAKQNPRAANRHLRGVVEWMGRGCELGRISVCHLGGQILEVSNKGLDARPFYQRGCTGGEARSCANLGGLYAYGNGLLSRDEEEAIAYLEPACAQGNLESCAVLGDLLQESDVPRARKLFERSCEADVPLGCLHYGRVLGTEAETNPEARGSALRAAEKACAREFGKGCVLLGDLYAAGEPTPEDWQAAMRAYRKACEQEALEGCAKIGDLLLAGEHIERDEAEAYSFHLRACYLHSGSDYRCMSLGRIYEQGLGVEADWRQALMAYTRECQPEENRFQGCYTIGELFETGRAGEKDLTLAHEAYKRACQGYHFNACRRAEQLLLENRSVRISYAVANIQLVEGECDNDIRMSCYLLAIMHENREHPEPYKENVGYYYCRACELGYKPACERQELFPPECNGPH